MDAKLRVFVICVGAAVLIDVCVVLDAGCCTFRFCIVVSASSAAEGERCSGAFNTGSSQKCVFITKLESPTIINSQVSCYLWLTEN